VVVGLVAICSLLYVVIEQSVTVHYLEVGALHDRNEDPPDVDGVWNPLGTPARTILPVIQTFMTARESGSQTRGGRVRRLVTLQR
jgi:hypothetical protein